MSNKYTHAHTLVGRRQLRRRSREKREREERGLRNEEEEGITYTASGGDVHMHTFRLMIASTPDAGEGFGSEADVLT